VGVKFKIIENQDKIVLVTGIILIALIAFGLGRLSYNIGSQPVPIEITDANIFKTTEEAVKVGDNIEQIFVGSRGSDKYHLPNCSWAKKIKKENEIWFKSEQEAQENGYKPCSCVSHK